MISNKGEELSTPGRKGGSILLSRFAITHTPRRGDVQGKEHPNATPRHSTGGTHPSASKSLLGVAEAYALSPPGEEPRRL